MKRKNLKKLGWGLMILFLIGNFIVYNHAYKFTHFIDSKFEKTNRPEKLSFSQKLNAILLGIKIPKPINTKLPSKDYQTITLNSFETLEGWQITVPNQKGMVILFHGYSSSKASLLPYSEEFNNKGYSTFLIDFMGSGGSTGNTTTIGFKESRDVKAAYDYIKKINPEVEIILFGSSMGAVAIMKAIEKYDLKPSKLIIECPFGSMLTTTKKRFKAMNLPTFPFAEMLLFYGGIQTGFNPFKHKPTEYAKHINIPTLVLYGAKDERVTKTEIEQIYANLHGEKELVIFKNSEHEVYLNDDREDWNKAIDIFFGK